jgi:hypothetical protein
MAINARKLLRSFFQPRVLLWTSLAIVAAIAIYVGVESWIADRATIPVDVGERPITLLDPDKLLLVAICPFLYLLRMISLTDLSLTQQVVQATLRSAVIAALAVAAARPSWITETSKVSTIVLVDVSDSISDKQLAAAKKYVDEIEKSVGTGDMQVITFAEKPTVVRPKDGDARSTAIKRHSTGGAGTDTQAAMQLAYGLYPDGYLSRMVTATRTVTRPWRSPCTVPRPRSWRVPRRSRSACSA